ncbi:DUF305 domain-containing protein [Nonomuraea aridisoli]|uniref:DUF305 domain-containing protein n=1 Tax=Nonomuraea aridisoli TaxID=2070368 RepID=A0A2W2FPC6_9ACTN|nr:DUF305 domain-containing protein [Nonomuraea aridisoli]PZG23707.1 DUF305 domain-containing protein [Nonomuraea aridisoli]
MISLRLFVPSLLIAAAALTGCTADGSSATVVQPGRPGETGKVVPLDQVEEPETGYTDADVRFMQGMIRHHAQALQMTDLVAGRTESEGLPRLAKRIEISQQDEIDLMVRWLRDRMEQVPSVDSAHGHGHGGELMPGMLTDAQLAELRAAKGEQFDRLFYQYMIQHHTGALRMVERLYAERGGMEPEIDQFATHVDSDQRIEIARMQQLLAAL